MSVLCRGKNLYLKKKKIQNKKCYFNRNKMLCSLSSDLFDFFPHKYTGLANKIRISVLVFFLINNKKQFFPKLKHNQTLCTCHICNEHLSLFLNCH